MSSGRIASCWMPKMNKARDLPTKRPVTIRGPVEDVLGYDTTDFLQCAREMAQAALSGRNADTVEAELGAVRRRLSRGRGR
jgi:hypothetical protein